MQTNPQFSNPYFIRLMRLLWWLLAGTGMWIILTTLPLNLEVLETTPVSIYEDPAENLARTQVYQQALVMYGVSPVGYAVFKLFLMGVTLVVSYGMGFWIYRLRFEERMGMLSAFTFTAFGAFSALSPLATDGQLGNSYLAWMVAIVAWGGFYLFLILYPDGRLRPLWALISPVVWVLSLVTDVFGETPSGQGLLLFFVGAFGVPLAAQVYRYVRLFNPLQRQQVKWFLYILAWLLLVVVVIQPLWRTLDQSVPALVLWVDLLENLVGLSFLLLPLGVGRAILRYRLWDLDVIIRRTLQYALLTSVLGLGYFGSVAVLQSISTNVFGQQSNLFIAISTLIIAALFNPLRRRFQDLIDKRFYREKYNAEKALADFAEVARSQTDPNQLFDLVSHTVRQTLQPEQVSLWLKPAQKQPGIKTNQDGYEKI